jgi:hypothetical protein
VDLPVARECPANVGRREDASQLAQRQKEWQMHQETEALQDRQNEVMFVPAFAFAGIVVSIYLTLAESGSFEDFVTGMMLLGAFGYAADLLVWFARRMGRQHGMRWHWTMAALAAAAVHGLFFSDGEGLADMLAATAGTAILLLFPAIFLDALTASITRRVRDAGPRTPRP